MNHSNRYYHLHKYFFIGILIVLSSCFSSKKVAIEVEDKAAPLADYQSVAGIIEVLAHDSLAGRGLGTDGNRKAAGFIRDYLVSYNIPPFYDTYFDSLNTVRSPAANVIGVIEGRDPVLKDQFILLGAHFDHVGVIRKINGDSIANGANDNASGVSAVLNIARYFSQSQSNGRTLVFAFFDGEETGLNGSTSLALRMRKDSIKPWVMIGVDMIGTPLPNQPGKTYASGFDRTGFPKAFNTLNEDTLLLSSELDHSMGIFALSDNYPFYRLLKIPAHNLSTFEFSNYSYYHKVGDEIQELDIENMVEIINNLIPAIEKLSYAENMEFQ